MNDLISKLLILMGVALLAWVLLTTRSYHTQLSDENNPATEGAIHPALATSLPLPDAAGSPTSTSKGQTLEAPPTRPTELRPADYALLPQKDRRVIGIRTARGNAYSTANELSLYQCLSDKKQVCILFPSGETVQATPLLLKEIPLAIRKRLDFSLSGY